jgi:hypothetical protein
VYAMARKYMNYVSMTSLPSGPRLYCQLSKVRWTCWGVDMQWILWIHPTPSCASYICNRAKERGHVEGSIDEWYENRNSWVWH